MRYASRVHLLGLPLVHVAVGADDARKHVRGIARGWIAIGDIAFGVLFALGGIAVGGVSIGGLSLGVLALAGLAVGVWAFGGGALGVFALGGGAVAAWAADGGFAWATEFARGGVAIAQHANDPEAIAYFESSAFFRAGSTVAGYSRWLLLLVVLSPLIQWLSGRSDRRDADATR